MIIGGKNHFQAIVCSLKTKRAQQILQFAAFLRIIKDQVLTILRKTIEGYLDSATSLSFNTIKTLLIMYAFHSSRLLQSKLMFYFSHASMA